MSTHLGVLGESYPINIAVIHSQSVDLIETHVVRWDSRIDSKRKGLGRNGFFPVDYNSDEIESRNREEISFSSREVERIPPQWLCPLPGIYSGNEFLLAIYLPPFCGGNKRFHLEWAGKKKKLYLPSPWSSRIAWGSWKHDVLNNIGNHETAPWQRVLIRRFLYSGCQYVEWWPLSLGTYRDTGCQQLWQTALIQWDASILTRGIIIYKYDIPVGLPTWLSTPSEHCNPRATPSGDSANEG